MRQHTGARTIAATMSGLILENTMEGVDFIFSLALTTYCDLKGDGLWNAAMHPTPGAAGAAGAAGGFMALDQIKGPFCWTCGSTEHAFPHCTKVRNPAAIAENCALYWEHKGDDPSGSAGGRGVTNRWAKWKRPRPEENNKRIINNAPFTWNPSTKCWMKDDTHPIGLTAGTAGTPPSPPPKQQTGGEDQSRSGGPFPPTSIGEDTSISDTASPAELASVQLQLANLMNMVSKFGPWNLGADLTSIFHNTFNTIRFIYYRLLWNFEEIIASVFFDLIVTPIESMFTVESLVNMILILTYPIWLIFFVTINRSRITNTLLAPIRVCITTSPIIKYFPKPKAKTKSNMRWCYHYKRHRRHHLHCTSHRSRTGCRFQRPSSLSNGGGGCRKPKQKLKWKTTCSTRRKSRQCYRHNKTSSMFCTTSFTSSSTHTSNVFHQACTITKELSFFDAFDDLDDIMFEDAITSINVFHSCFDYCNDNIFLDQYQETCTETYYDTLLYQYPTSLTTAIEIDTYLGNNNWRDADDIEVNYLLFNGQCVPSNSKPLFCITANGIHKVSFTLAHQDALTADTNFVNPIFLSEHTSLSNSISRNIDSFLQWIHILNQSRIWSALLPSVSIPPSYKILPSSDLRYKLILLEAHRLRLNLSNYDERVLMPLQNPAVYHSNKPEELPIVIDTGASCSITPVHSDFISTIQPSNVHVLNNISGTTAVVGHGTIEWNIQDANGVVNPIQTSAYYVPQATIRLFSPQVYIKEDKSNTSEMTLKNNGVHLVLSCGTSLFFPINCGSNLPIMLTETALNSFPAIRVLARIFYAYFLLVKKIKYLNKK
jgi:hypothetical protein